MPAEHDHALKQIAGALDVGPVSGTEKGPDELKANVADGLFEIARSIDRLTVSMRSAAAELIEAVREKP